MRRCHWVRSLSLPVLALAGLLLSADPEAVLGQTSGGAGTPIEVRSVRLQETPVGPDLLIEAGEPLEWIADVSSDGDLVLFLARSVPGPHALDISRAGGPILGVEVGLSLPDGVPTTRIVVHSREPFEYHVIPDGKSLRVQLRATNDASPSAVAPAAPAEPLRVEARPGEQVSTGSGLRDELLKVKARAASLERDLSSSRAALEAARGQQQVLEVRVREAEQQSETHRQRALGLQAERLRLIEELGAAEEASTPTTADDPGDQEQLRRQLEVADERIAAANREIEDLRGGLQQAEAVATDKEALALRVNELETVVAESREARAEIAALQQANDRLQEERQRLAEQDSDSRQRMAKLVVDLETARQELAEVRLELGATKLAAEERLARLRDLLDGEVVVVSGAAQPCLKVRSGPEAEAERLDCVVPGTELSLQSIEGEWVEIAVSEDLRGWVAAGFVESSARVGQRRLNESLEADREQLAAVTGERDRLAAELETTRQQIAELETAVAGATSATSEERLALQTDLDAALESLEAAREEAASLQALQTELEEERVQLVAVAGQRDRLRAELETVGKRVEELEVQLGDAAGREAGVRDTLGGAEARARALEIEVGEQTALKESLAEEVEAVRSELAESQAALAELRQEISAAELAGRERLARLRDLLGGGVVVVSEAAQPCLTVRSGPEVRAQRLDCVAPGTELSLRDLEGEWVEVAGSGDLLGWVASGFVESASHLGQRQLNEALEGERARLADLSGDRDRLEGELQTARQRITDLESAAAGATTVAAQEHSALRADLDSARQETASLRPLQGELESERERLATVAGERDRLEAELEVAEKRAQELEASLSDASDTAGEQEAALRAELTKLSEALEAAQAQVASLERSRSELSGEQEQLMSTIAQQNERAEELRQARSRVAELESEVAASAEALASSEASAEMERQSRLDAEQALSDLQQTVAGLENERDLLREAAADDELEQVLAASQDRIAALEAELATAREELEPSTRAATEQEEIAGTAVVPTEAAAAESADVPPLPAPIVDPSEDLVTLVGSWARAWSAQDVEGYLSFYSLGFRPPPGLSRMQWEEQRRQRLTAPSFIEIDVSSFSPRVVGPGRGAVTFRQGYRSNTFEDFVTKTLELVFEDGEWKILAEVAE